MNPSAPAIISLGSFSSPCFNVITQEKGEICRLWKFKSSRVSSWWHQMISWYYLYLSRLWICHCFLIVLTAVHSASQSEIKPLFVLSTFFITSNTILRFVLTDSHFFFPVAPGNSNSISITGYRLEGYFCPLIPLGQIWSDMFRSLAFWCLNKLCRHLLPKDFGGFTPSALCRIDRNLQTIACNE